MNDGVGDEEIEGLGERERERERVRFTKPVNT